LKKAKQYKIYKGEITFYNGNKKLFTMRKIEDKKIKLESNADLERLPIDGDFRIISQKENGEDVERIYNKTSIKFDGKEGRFSAIVGCNIINGEFSIDKQNIKTTSVLSTLMSCENELNQLEEAFVDNINHVATFKKEANHLYLYGKGGKLVLFLEHQ
jgi:heat shock protein HslJ